jgi:hypothetical protein
MPEVERKAIFRIVWNRTPTDAESHSRTTDVTLRRKSQNLCAAYSIVQNISLIKTSSWVIKSRRLRWAGYVARMGERRGAYRALVGKPEGKRWEDNIKMDLREVGWGAWTGSIWLRIGTGGELL